MEIARVEVHIGVGLEAQGKTLVALEAQAVISWLRPEHARFVHVMAAGTGRHIQGGMGAQCKLGYLALVAGATDGCIVFVGEIEGGWGTHRHAPFLVDVMTVGAGGTTLHEMVGGEEALDRATAWGRHIVVAGRARLMATIHGVVPRVVDEEAKAPTLLHMGQAGAVTGFASDGFVGAVQILMLITGTATIVTSQAGSRSDFTRAEGRSVTAVHPTAQKAYDQQSAQAQRGPSGQPNADVPPSPLPWFRKELHVVPSPHRVPTGISTTNFV